MLMIIKRKMNSVHLLHFETQTCSGWTKGAVVGVCDSRERKCVFSLDFQPFGPSVLDGARSKVVLCDEGYTWTLIW